ncbi:Prolactin-7D1 [Fukomys damarensis]|uniref:Prolactin n=1 Tax=Fukomys damarensis TaxID=885580 RepID=A0A091DCM6_FUKDA|nr:Prolactin-7D1 [Fukomys damarensis]
MVMRLLDSWKEPLPHVAEETHKFMKFYSPIKKKDESIYLRYQQFKSVIIEIASKLGLETSVQDFASWSDMESLKSSDDQTRLFTVYNLLRCFAIDADKLEFLVYILKCLADNEDPC